MTNVPPPPPPPPPPGFGGQPPYGMPGFGGPSNVREHPSGTTVLVLGILGLVLGFACCLGFVLSPIAWAKGASARKEMQAAPGITWTNGGQVTAGWVCGIIGTAFVALGVIAFVIIVAAGAA